MRTHLGSPLCHMATARPPVPPQALPLPPAPCPVPRCPGCPMQHPADRHSAPGGCSIPPCIPLVGARPGTLQLLVTAGSGSPWVPPWCQPQLGGAPAAPSLHGQSSRWPCLHQGPGSLGHREAPRGRQGDPGQQRLEGHRAEGTRVQGGDPRCPFPRMGELVPRWVPLRPSSPCPVLSPPGALIGSCWQVPRDPGAQSSPRGKKKRVTSQLWVGFFSCFCNAWPRCLL